MHIDSCSTKMEYKNNWCLGLFYMSEKMEYKKLGNNNTKNFLRKLILEKTVK